jgi:hypothetical protein
MVITKQTNHTHTHTHTHTSSLAKCKINLKETFECFCIEPHLISHYFHELFDIHHVHIRSCLSFDVKRIFTILTSHVIDKRKLLIFEFNWVPNSFLANLLCYVIHVPIGKVVANISKTCYIGNKNWTNMTWQYIKFMKK